MKRINTLLARDRLFHRAVVAASRNLSLFTHSFGKFVGALFATRYIKARESSDALKNSILPLPLYRFRTASRVFICQRVAANEIFSPSSSLSLPHPPPRCRLSAPTNSSDA